MGKKHMPWRGDRFKALAGGKAAAAAPPATLAPGEVILVGDQAAQASITPDEIEAMALQSAHEKKVEADRVWETTAKKVLAKHGIGLLPSGKLAVTKNELTGGLGAITFMANQAYHLNPTPEQVAVAKAKLAKAQEPAKETNLIGPPLPKPAATEAPAATDTAPEAPEAEAPKKEKAAVGANGAKK